MTTYAKLGMLYYVIYNPQYWVRDQHQPFEVYRLVNGAYELQIGEPYWMPEVDLGLGRSLYLDGSMEREVLYWYNAKGDRYLTPEEQLAYYRKRFGELPQEDVNTLSGRCKHTLKNSNRLYAFPSIA